MSKGKPNKRYTPEFKIMVVETMQNEKLSYHEAARQFNISNHQRVADWERIYLEEDKEGFYIERRGRKSTGCPPKVKKEVEEDLIAEVQRLRVESDSATIIHVTTQGHFNPRSPCGERRTRLYSVGVMYNFNPRSPCGERPSRSASRLVGAVFQSTLSVWRATKHCCSICIKAHCLRQKTKCCIPEIIRYSS